MNEVDEVWRQKSDEQVLEAFVSLDDYGTEGQRAVQAEFVRRGLAVPATKPITSQEAEAVARLHRWFALLVFAQSLSFAAILWTPLGYLRAVRPLLALIFIGSVVAAPVMGYRLLKKLGVERPSRTAMFMYWPLFSALTLLGMRSFNGQWSKEHKVDVGILGPTSESLWRLRNTERHASPSAQVPE